MKEMLPRDNKRLIAKKGTKRRGWPDAIILKDNKDRGPWWWWSSGQRARLLVRRTKFESR